MSGRPANPTDGSAHPARAARRASGARAELGAIARGVGGVGRLLLIAAGFGLALVLLATTVLNNRQPDSRGDSRVVVPGVWAADDSRPNEAAQRAAERDAELDRARREAEQASAKSALGDSSEDPKDRHGSADDDHGPPVGNEPEGRNERRPSEGAGASTPPDPEPSEEEPRKPASNDPRPPTPKPTKSAEPTKAPDPAASKSPTGSPKPAPSEPSEPSMEPTDQDPTVSPTSPPPSATPTSTPRPGDDDDDDECTIKLLGLCL